MTPKKEGKSQKRLAPDYARNDSKADFSTTLEMTPRKEGKGKNASRPTTLEMTAKKEEREKQIPRCARDFVCGLPLCSRPQSDSRSLDFLTARAPLRARVERGGP